MWSFLIYRYHVWPYIYLNTHINTSVFSNYKLEKLHIIFSTFLTSFFLHFDMENLHNLCREFQKDWTKIQVEYRVHFVTIPFSALVSQSGPIWHAKLVCLSNFSPLLSFTLMKLSALINIYEKSHIRVDFTRLDFYYLVSCTHFSWGVSAHGWIWVFRS